MSKKLLAFFVLLFIALIFIGYGLFFSRVKGISGIKIVTNPTTSVFLNDQLVGKTPYDNKHPAGDYTVKLIPEEAGPSATSWQGNVTLFPSLLTFVGRDLGSSELMTGGEILTLEKLSGGDEAQIDMSGSPDGFQVLLDGQEKGISPVLLRDVVPGEHDVTAQAVGFVARTIRVNAISGYTLKVDVSLALGAEPLQPTGTPSATLEGEGTESAEGNQVLIKDTPTGFLRVRTTPSTSSSESAQVKPGETFPFTEEQDGWYKIIYEEGKEGWISGRYAEKVE